MNGTRFAAGLSMAAAFASLPASLSGALEDPAREAELRVHELRKEKRYQEALAYVELSVKQSPESGNLRGLACWIYLEDLKDPRSALGHALRLKRELPGHRGGYYWSARSYEALGDYGKCVAALDDFRPYGRDFVRDNVKASCYYKSGQLEEAIKALPDEESLQDNYRKYEGWSIWLRGQIARRKILPELKPKLQAQAAAPSARERLIALAKLALLGVAEGAPLAERAGAAEKGALKPVADNLRRELTAEPRFYRENEPPRVPDEARPVRLEDAFAEIFKALDEGPGGNGRIPPIGGKYMTPDMLEMVKKFPSLASTPFVVQIDEAARRYSFGLAWVTADGQIDTSFEPGRWYTYSEVRDGALRQVAVGLRNWSAEFSTMSWRPDGPGLVSATRTWIDRGDVFYVHDTAARFVKVP